MSPKPVYERLMGLIKGKWWTQEDRTTDDQGHARFRGFLGEYQVTVTVGGKSITHEMLLQADKPNELIIKSATD